MSIRDQIGNTLTSIDFINNKLTSMLLTTYLCEREQIHDGPT